MFGSKKEPKRRPRPAKAGGGSLAQYGLFDIPDNVGNLDGTGDTEDENDEDLEAELAALTSGSGAAPKRRKAPGKPVPSARLDSMVEASLKDLGSDEELSGDDDDPDLLNELNEITGVEASGSPEPADRDISSPGENSHDDAAAETLKLLEERIAGYRMAVEKAEARNDRSRARRFGRGLKTLEELIRSARQGRPIDVSEVPPVLPPSATEDSTAPTSPPPPRTSNVPEEQPNQDQSANVVDEPKKAVDPEILRQLQERRQEYRTAALAWKRVGNNEKAIEHVRLAKCFDTVIAAAEAGEAIDLSDMPASPSLPDSASASTPASESGKEESETQNESPPRENGNPGSGDLGTLLRERLEIYRRSKVAADTEGNSSKARRYGRICKQFEDAVKRHDQGKPIPVEELPTPPGFPPLSSVIGGPPPPVDAAPAEEQPSPDETVTAKEETPTAPVPNRTPPVVPPRQNAGKGRRPPRTRADKQLAELQQRQHELKQAALSAKKDGDTELARTYLRQAKGIDPLIQASIAGLPVDMNSVPLSPLAKLRLDEAIKAEDFVVTDPVDGTGEEINGDDAQIYENLESQLIRQIKTCLSTRDHSKALGDVPGYNRWERLALGYTRDLDVLRVRRRDGLPPPQHRYETKTFAIVQSCTDLKDTDIEITIVRGVNYAREADTYVIVEFPYPTDNPASNRTSTVRDSSNPEYSAVFLLSGGIERTARQCQRVFKRHGIKCQVWAKGCSSNLVLCCTHPRGFFRSDSLLGTVTVKLQPLETQCVLHDSFPLMEGRKAVGGKLEVKIRLRDPMVTKQIEQSTDKWLTIDH